MEDMQSFWIEIKDYLRDILSQSTYKNWVDATYPIRFDNRSITIAVANKMTKKYWEDHLAGYVLQYSNRRFGTEYQPIFTIVQDNEENFRPQIASNSEVDLKNTQTDYTTESHLNPNYTFENFVIGEDNKMASVAALAVVESPGKTYNPFLIYGGVGLGKTHLMQAIGNEIKHRNPGAKIKYATSESFVNDFITSIQNGSQDHFRQMYREIDILLIDDIQFLSNKDKTQEEFFHTFNALYNNGKQIVLTSDRLPNNITNLEERLISRFKWGLSTDITPPDLETRIAILRKKASTDNLDINSETLTYIASHIDSNIRELEGALVRVIAYAAIKGLDITTDLAAEALKNIVDDNQQNDITPKEIIDQVARYYNVTVTDIIGKKRKKEIVIPRQIAMYLSRQLTELSFPKIGEEFGHKNHTTVIHAFEKINDEISYNIELKEDINKLKKLLMS